MDIKIGFADSPRELTFSTEASQEEIQAAVAAAMDQDSGMLELADDRGRKYLIRNNRIAYVELGTATVRQVGFIG
ncbi:DUF3107 domain-containing protein [Corynebacterium sp. H128]|uniref:DUF3107 domain-containing protein n=1 Tax=unclassified Corynebacterium TaxID=2624378 RepID=UPI0030B582D6